MDLLKEIQKDLKTAFIFISHDFGLVYEAADKVAVMYAGHVVENSTAEELFKNPKHPYTQALLKALPNFNTKELKPIEGQPPSIKDCFKGCVFEPRCEKRKEICANKMPETSIINDAKVNCWLYNNQ